MENLLSTNEETRQRWRRALDLVEQASELPARERAAWLTQKCGGDTQLNTTVRELLDAANAAEAEGFMEEPPCSFAPPPDDDPLRLIGQQLGAWRLTHFVSAGGMGRVYLAARTDELFDRQVAIKVLGKNLSEQAYQRFKREVRILGALQHPNLVFLYDAGRMPDGQPYLVMEYLPGPDLRAWLTGRGALPTAQALGLTQQICAGLHAAHQAGVIHRDLKPANLIVTEAPDGQLTIKLLDFGLAYRQQPQAFDTALTEVGTRLGTIAYMSPEQIRGVSHEQLTPAADLYALGLIVYEMLTGRRAFLGTTREDFIADHLQQMPPPPTVARPDLPLPKAVDQVVLKALAKAPAERYQSAPEFAAALTAALQPPELPPPPFPWLKLALAWLLLGVLAGAVYWVWQRQSTAPPVVAVNPSPPPLAVSPTPLPIAPSPSPAAPSPSPAAPTPPPARPPGLQVLLRVQNGAKQPLPGSRFELFKAGLPALPRVATPANTLCAQTTAADGTAACGDVRVLPGTFWVRVRSAGHKNFEGQAQLRESKREPGSVRLTFTLERK